MQDNTNRFPDAYHAGHYQELAEQLAAMLSQHMRDSRAEEGSAVLPPYAPEELLRALPDEFPEFGYGEAPAMTMLQDVIDHSIHLHHPRYIGHQVTAPLPIAALADHVAATLNNSSAVFEMGQMAVAMELRLTQWIGRLIGYAPETSGGILTSGGSLGNLTALLAARQAQCEGDVWQDGYADGLPPAVLVSEQAHYCVDRACRIMGLGDSGAIKVPSDHEYRLDIGELHDAYERTRKAGRQVIAVVASACTTSTGTMDPVAAIADFCEARGLWLHVDGAHGAAAMLSSKYRPLLDGLNRADSVVWDLHKMMLMPALITAVMYKDKRHSHQAMQTEAAYLLGNNAEEEWYNLSYQTIECTKPSMAFKAYISLMAYGPTFFGDYVTRMFDLTRQFYLLLQRAGDFEVAVPPDCNILCFRYLPEQPMEDEALNQLQDAIRRRLVESGEYYIVRTTLKGRRYLRCTLINPLTQASHLQHLLSSIRMIAADLETEHSADMTTSHAA